MNQYFPVGAFVGASVFTKSVHSSTADAEDSLLYMVVVFDVCVCVPIQYDVLYAWLYSYVWVL